VKYEDAHPGTEVPQAQGGVTAGGGHKVWAGGVHGDVVDAVAVALKRLQVLREAQKERWRAGFCFTRTPQGICAGRHEGGKAVLRNISAVHSTAWLMGRYRWLLLQGDIDASDLFLTVSRMPVTQLTTCSSAFFPAMSSSGAPVAVSVDHAQV